jgi:hypothetical protein
LKYIDEHWPEVERVVVNALEYKKGRVRQFDLQALPLDQAGRVSVLRRYARTHPESTSFGYGLWGWTLWSLEPHAASGERDRRQDSRDGTA